MKLKKVVVSAANVAFPLRLEEAKIGKGRLEKVFHRNCDYWTDLPTRIFHDNYHGERKGYFWLPSTREVAVDLISQLDQDWKGAIVKENKEMKVFQAIEIE